MSTREQLLKKFGSPEKVSEYYRELQKKSRKNYKGTGGFLYLKQHDPKKLKEISRLGGKKRHQEDVQE